VGPVRGLASCLALAGAVVAGTGEPWYVRASGIATCAEARPARKVRVAIVDDGFRLTDPVLAPFFRGGLDLADGDPDPGLPRGSEALFWHGTYLAGVVADAFGRCWGDRAAEALEIVPVKVVEDRDPSLRFDRGYAALEALDALSPDVVLLAWSGGVAPASAQAAIATLRRRGTMVFASAGNLGTGIPQAPSSLAGVVAVAEIDSAGARPARAGHGRHVLLLGPGKGVVGRASTEDRWIALDEGGSSAAAAWVAGLYGVALSRTKARPEAVLASIVGSARAPGSGWDRPGLGGAGFARLPAAGADAGEALWGLLRPGARPRRFSTSRQDALGMVLRTDPGCEGLELVATSAEGGRQVLKGDRADPESLLVAARTVSVTVRGGKASCLVRWGFLLRDSSAAYCSGERVVAGDSGRIDDGSGEADYADRTDCRTRIEVPPGKVVRLDFEALDTQEGVDFLHVFAGPATRQDRLQALYSGTATPAPLVVPSQVALLWFVSDERIRGKGFAVRWKAVDPPGSPPLIRGGEEPSRE